MLQLPICYFPTTVLFLDNDKKFLNNLFPTLEEDILIKTYDDPATASEYLNKNSLIQNITQDVIYFEEPQVRNRRRLNINIRAIHQEIYNSQRFAKISVLVVSYSIDGMNGIKLCQKVPDVIKKILLTDEVDERLIIEAFNERSINKFIPKQNGDLKSVLQNAIHELQQRIFQEFSENIIHIITHNTSHPLSCLKDPNFISFFLTLIQENKLIEYYLLDSQGSFLFLDKQAKPSWLVVATDAKMNEYYQLALSKQTPKSVIKMLKEKTSIPFLFSDEKSHSNSEKSLSHLHSAKKLEGDQLYYYAYINDEQYNLKQKTVISYADWLSANNFRL